MKGGTHAAIGLLTGLILADVLHFGGAERLAIAAVGAAAALLPDLDHPQAALRQRIGLAGHVAFGWLNHRGILHSLIIPILLGALITVMRADSRLWVIPAGYLSHLIGDFVTVQGIPLFAPLSWRRLRLPLMRTGSLLEWIVLGGTLAGIIALIT